MPKPQRWESRRLGSRPLLTPAAHTLSAGVLALALYLLLHQTFAGGLPCAPQPAGEHRCDTLTNLGSLTRAVLGLGVPLGVLVQQALRWVLDLVLLALGLGVCAALTLVGLVRWLREPRRVSVPPAQPVEALPLDAASPRRGGREP